MDACGINVVPPCLYSFILCFASSCMLLTLHATVGVAGYNGGLHRRSVNNGSTPSSQDRSLTTAAANVVDPGTSPGVSYNRLPNRGSAGRRVSGLCSVYPDIKLPKLIKKRRDDGVKLITFNIVFPEYEEQKMPNPLRTNMKRNFQADVWQRAYDKHGRTLLSLAFNYDILSLMMLTFGVEKLKANVYDSPAYCFSKLTEDEKIKSIMNVTLSNFEGGDPKPMGENDFICHQLIHRKKESVEFKYSCCNIPQGTKKLRCIDEIPDTWYDVLNGLIVTIKIAFLLFGPLFIQRWIYKESIRTTDYIVKLKDVLVKTLLVKKVDVPDYNENNRDLKEMCKFRKKIKNIPSDEIITTKFSTLQLLVDHRQLIPEDSVPVGLVQALFRNIVLCGIRRKEPFTACCEQSIFGSWTPKFLWLHLKGKCDCNESFKQSCAWVHIFKLLGGILLLFLIPVPYYIRLVAYYRFEDETISLRRNTADELGLYIPLQYNLVQYLTPTHAFLIIVYLLYIFCIIFLALLRACDRDHFDKIVRGALQDLRQVSYLEVLRLFFCHLLLPVEKFGLCGLLLGLIYWPIAFPICFMVAVCYCVPLVYLMGRFMITRRPDFLREKPYPSPPKPRRQTSKDLLSNGTTSFESALLLENISQRERVRGAPKTASKVNLRVCCPKISGVLIGINCIGLMLSIMLMAAECFGFFVEVCVFTLMGAIVNAGSAAKYLMLGFWMIMYASSCYNNVYAKYLALNKKLFAYIKDKLKDDIKAVTRLREEKQKNTAFKFFSRTELKQEDKLRYELDDDDDDDDDDSDSDPEKEEHHGRRHSEREKCHEDPVDNIDCQHKKLHWTVHSLVLFVDVKDKPRIPRDLFKIVCEIEAPGCPGPVYKSLLKATQQLMYMIVFLVFVFIVITAFGDIYRISSTNQMLVTLAGGFVPFVIRFVMAPKQQNLSLNTYSFEGKVFQAIRKFEQAWPVYDLCFKIIPTGGAPGYHSMGQPGSDNSQPPSIPSSTALPDPGPGTAENLPVFPEERVPGSAEDIDVTHVDLLIRVRNDMDGNLENIRSQPASRASGNASQADPSSPERPNVNNSGEFERPAQVPTDNASTPGSLESRNSPRSPESASSLPQAQGENSTSPVDSDRISAEHVIDVSRCGEVFPGDDSQRGSRAQSPLALFNLSPYRRVPKEEESKV